MSIELRSAASPISLLGLSLQHDPAKTFGEEIRHLLDRVWPILKSRHVANEGINWVVYEKSGRLFAGVEAPGADAHALGLERSEFHFPRYALATHIGPYHLLKLTHAAMLRELEAQRLVPDWPRAEVYGHWNSDESKLVTEIWMRIAEVRAAT